MRKLICCLSLILVASSFASAQDVLIKHNGDSLVGKLNFAKDALGLEYATIKVGRKRQQVKLFDIRAYCLAQINVVALDEERN